MKFFDVYFHVLYQHRSFLSSFIEDKYSPTIAGEFFHGEDETNGIRLWKASHSMVPYGISDYKKHFLLNGIPFSGVVSEPTNKHYQHHFVRFKDDGEPLYDTFTFEDVVVPFSWLKEHMYLDAEILKAKLEAKLWVFDISIGPISWENQARNHLIYKTKELINPWKNKN